MRLSELTSSSSSQPLAVVLFELVNHLDALLDALPRLHKMLQRWPCSSGSDCTSLFMSLKRLSLSVNVFAQRSSDADEYTE